MDAQEVDGYAGEHDDETDAANHRLRVKTETQQQRPEHQVAHRDQQVHLDKTHSSQFTVMTVNSVITLNR